MIGQTGDRHQLRILRNLITNALDYTQDSRVLVAARSRGQTVCIAVYDTGPGIPKDQQERNRLDPPSLNPLSPWGEGWGEG